MARHTTTLTARRDAEPHPPVTRMERLGGAAARNRVWVLAGAVALLIILWAAAGTVGGQFSQGTSLPGTESQAATERFEAAGFETHGRQAGTVVIHADGGVEADAVQEPARSFLSAIATDVDGVTVHDPYADADGRLISPDGSTAIARLDFTQDDRDAALAAAEEIAGLRDEVALPADADIELGGDLFAEEPDFSSTGLGLIAAAVILFVAFGSLLAMGLPIATALLGIACGMAVVQLASRWIDIPPFAPAAVAMIGLGAGINYALFIVTRYREELAGGLSPGDATSRALGTAGKSAFFAGATVVTSLLGLLVVGIDEVRSLALAIIAGVAFVMLASVTVLPALLGFVRDRIDRFGLPHRRRLGADEVERSPWFRWSRLLQRRPLPVAVAVAALLLIVALPVTDLRLGIADASTRSADDTTHRAHELIADGFGEGFNGPVLLAVSLPEDGGSAALEHLASRLADRDDVAAVLPAVVNDDEDTAFVQVIPTTAPQDERTAALVHDLRDTALASALGGTGADALVGGVVAAGIDFADINARVLPWFIAVVLLLSFVLLAVVFRSVLVPLKAIVVNLLTVGAAYGVVVAVFQWGWLGGVFGQGQPGPIEPWVPMMLFAITFGLSIDYEVFLLSRVREYFDDTGDNATAVSYGLARSARLIFAAAAIMVCVFGAFALLANREMQMLGLGLAVAIAVDATLVRLVLVPTTLELLGDRNWWWPARLQRARPAGVTRGGGVG
jgi:putative drug exporter of the RND superfamily